MQDVEEFSKAVHDMDDRIMMENADGTISLPSSSILSILRMAYSGEPFFFVKNDTNDGVFPSLCKWQNF